MVLVNENFEKLPGSYLFSEIARRVKVYSEENSNCLEKRKLIRMGIGDVTKPLVPAVIEAMHKAVDEMGDAGTFRGYGPEHGYQFLQEKIIEHDYTKRGIKIEKDEVFVSDGCKSDMGNIGGIFGTDNVVAVTDPVYPVYVDSNVMEGRGGELNESGNWSKIVYLPCTAENNYEPALPKEKVDIIYLCFPNNPLGTTLNKAQLTKWVEYALKNKSIILYDSAYEAFITEQDVPHSIYEIENAKYCAIEFRSFSKTAGFTGMRCGYTVIPKEVVAYNHNGVAQKLNPIWNRRQCTKFNGVSYVTQKAAEAVYSKEGLIQCKKNIDYYLNNAKIIRENLEALGFEVFGGINAPYIWMKTPNNETSWDFFDILLKDINIVATPGSGFGPCGEGCIRLTAFGTKEDTVEAMERIKEWKNKK